MLKYYIQSGLDSLDASRKKLLDQLLEVDQTMEKPRDEDVERVRYCPNCYVDVDGRLCVHCEMDELFQVCVDRNFTHLCDRTRSLFLTCFYFLICYLPCFRIMRLGSFSEKGTMEELSRLLKRP